MAFVDSLRYALRRDDVTYLGNRRAPIRKLTPAAYKELSAVVENLPGLAVRVMLTQGEDFYETVFAAVEIAMDEFVSVVSVLSGFDRDFIEKEAGITEIVDYIILTAKKNNFAETVKNVKSLLPKQA